MNISNHNHENPVIFTEIADFFVKLRVISPICKQLQSFHFSHVVLENCLLMALYAVGFLS